MAQAVSAAAIKRSLRQEAAKHQQGRRSSIQPTVGIQRPVVTLFLLESVIPVSTSVPVNLLNGSCLCFTNENQVSKVEGHSLD